MAVQFKVLSKSFVIVCGIVVVGLILAAVCKVGSYLSDYGNAINEIRTNQQRISDTQREVIAGLGTIAKQLDGAASKIEAVSNGLGAVNSGIGDVKTILGNAQSTIGTSRELIEEERRIIEAIRKTGNLDSY